MNCQKYTLVFLLFFTQLLCSQVLLEADGPGNTYALINSVLANPNRNVVEAPDCSHPDFGNHIDEVFDTDLNKNIFRFHIHVSPDNDRCKKFDRQRNEIKSYKDSPENLKGNIGETVIYKWKLKLSDTFKVSSSFSHIHQIKSVGGPYASIPMISFTLRKGNPDRLELRYTATKSQETLKKGSLEPLKGNWVEVYEKVTFGNKGSYAVEIKNIKTQEIVFSYSNSNLDLWQDGAEFTRPKWGIYRSLKNKENLQDEIVKYADFSIKEITEVSTVVNFDEIVAELKAKAENILLIPDASSKEVTFINGNSVDYDKVELYDDSGRKILIEKRLKKDKIDVSNLSKGLYFIVLKTDTTMLKVLKCYIK